jgi:hypothetical protein
MAPEHWECKGQRSQGKDWKQYHLRRSESRTIRVGVHMWPERGKNKGGRPRKKRQKQMTQAD